MIEAINIHRKFDELEVLKGVDLTVGREKLCRLLVRVVLEKLPCCRFWVHLMNHMKAQ